MDNFASVDFPSLLSSPATARAPPVISWSDRRNLQRRLVLLKGPYSTPSVTTVTVEVKRGIGVSSFKQARLGVVIEAGGGE